MFEYELGEAATWVGELVDFANRLRAFARRPLLARCHSLTSGRKIVLGLGYVDPAEVLVGLRLWNPQDYLALTYDPYLYYNYFLVGGSGRPSVELVLSMRCPGNPQI